MTLQGLMCVVDQPITTTYDFTTHFDEDAMRTPAASKNAGVGDGTGIAEYSRAQVPAQRTICDTLCELITAALPRTTAKVWHGSPVWFIDENPVVGYNTTAKVVKLLFWNGQAFDEPDLKPVGQFRAAQAVFSNAADIDPKIVRRWLKKARTDVFDSKGFFKKRREAK